MGCETSRALVPFLRDSSPPESWELDERHVMARSDMEYADEENNLREYIVDIVETSLELTVHAM